MGLYQSVLIFLTLIICSFSSGEVTTSENVSNNPAGNADCPVESTDSIGYQCAMGVYNNVVSLLQLPGNLGKMIALGQRNLAACNSNPEIKRGMLLVLEPMIDVTQWMSMTCEQIIEASNLREQYLLRQVSAKRNEQSRIENLIQRSSSDPTRIAFLNQRLERFQLSEGEQSFIDRYVARENLVERLSGADIAAGLRCVTYKEVLTTTCELIVEAASLGIAARAVRPAVRGIEKSVGRLATGSSTFRSVVTSFRNSSRIDFYDGSGKVTAMDINPGDSFTVIIRDGRLILGKNIPGETGIPGGNGSHVTLMRLMGEENPYLYYGRGGAVRFNEDGSVDISGYHLEDDAHPRAYRDIEALMRSISPEATFRSTPDRLSTLPRTQ